MGGRVYLGSFTFLSGEYGRRQLDNTDVAMDDPDISADTFTAFKNIISSTGRRRYGPMSGTTLHPNAIDDRRAS